MREQDLLLQKFLDAGLDALENDDLDRLEQLLMQPDQDILAWLWDSDAPEDPELRAIVTIMQSRIQLKTPADE